MKNLKSYSGNTFKFYSELLMGKRDKDLKIRLKLIDDDIKLAFSEYQTHFDVNKLKRLSPINCKKEIERDLNSLYDSKRKPIQDLKVELTTDSNNRVDDICQNCTINSADTLDHILPQSVYPEFSVNPINLIPCCSQCNRHKSVAENKNEELFLNLYIDFLPNQQFLFVNFDFTYNSLVPNFYCENINGIDEALFEKIKAHFKTLHLYDRFKRASFRHISELINLVRESRNRYTDNEIVDLIVNIEQGNQTFFGRNYWVSILKSTLVQDNSFFNLVDT